MINVSWFLIPKTILISRIRLFDIKHFLTSGNNYFYTLKILKRCLIILLCRLRSIAALRDHFVRRLSVGLSVRLSGSHTFLVVTHSYVSQATHAFLGMLPLCYIFWWIFNCKKSNIRNLRLDQNTLIASHNSLILCYKKIRTNGWGSFCKTLTT